MGLQIELALDCLTRKLKPFSVAARMDCMTHALLVEDVFDLADFEYSGTFIEKDIHEGLLWRWHSIIAAFEAKAFVITGRTRERTGDDSTNQVRTAHNFTSDLAPLVQSR